MLSDSNKVLWLVFIISINGLISLTVKNISSKKVQKILCGIFTVHCCSCNVCYGSGIKLNKGGIIYVI